MKRPTKSKPPEKLPMRRQYTALVGALSESPMKEALVAAGLGHVKYGIICRHLLLLGKALPPPAVDATVQLRGLASKAYS